MSFQEPVILSGALELCGVRAFGSVSAMVHHALKKYESHGDSVGWTLIGLPYTKLY